jgi:tagatose 1,6-diphosphate aldolase
VRLLFPFARRHGFKTIYITCNPDNRASRRTCERLGATLVEIIKLPPDNDMYQDGEREKCRYRINLDAV